MAFVFTSHSASGVPVNMTAYDSDNQQALFNHYNHYNHNHLDDNVRQAPSWTRAGNTVLVFADEKGDWVDMGIAHGIGTQKSSPGSLDDGQGHQAITNMP